MEKDCLEIPILGVYPPKYQLHGEIETEIVLFMDTAFPGWWELVNRETFIGYIIEENGFLFINSNIASVVRLSVLYQSLADTYRMVTKPSRGT